MIDGQGVGMQDNPKECNAGKGVKSSFSDANKPTVKRAHDRQRTFFICIMLAIPVMHFLVFSIYLNLDTVLFSFQHRNIEGKYVFWRNPFKNYIDFFHDVTLSYSTFPRAVLNSLMYFLVNDFVIVPLSVLFTYFLYKKVFLHQVYRVVFYLPCIISMVVMIMSYRFMFDSTFGIVDPFLRAVGLEHVIPEYGWFGSRKTANQVIVGYCIWVGIGGNLVLLASCMGRIPEELIEAARMDGVGFFREFWTITIPLIGPTLSTLYMLGTTVIFTFYLQVKLLTNGGPDGQTATIMFFIVENIKTETYDLSGSATVGMIVALFGTPLVMLTRFLVDKLFPTYEY